MSLLSFAMPRGVMKPFLKKDDALRDLSSRTWKSICNRKSLDVDASSSSISSSALSSVIDPINSKVEETRQKLDNGNFDLQMVLEHLNDEKLKQVLLLCKQKTGFNVDDRFVSLSYLLIDEMEVLDKYIQHCQITRNNILRMFVKAYASKYHLQKGQELTFNHELFKKDVENILNVRKGLQLYLQRNSGVENVEMVEANENNNNCVVM